MKRTEASDNLEPDLPRAFGSDTAWLAVRADDPLRVAARMQLYGLRPANWQVGISESYQGEVFVSPAVGAWILVASTALLSVTAEPERIEPLVLELSHHFGEAQFFCTQRDLDVQIWTQAVAGRLIRAFGYSGDLNEVLWSEGAKTLEERQLDFRFLEAYPPEVELGDSWECELTFPDEACVMRLAGVWSLNPLRLDEASQMPGLGLLGRLDREHLGL